MFYLMLLMENGKTILYGSVDKRFVNQEQTLD